MNRWMQWMGRYGRALWLAMLVWPLVGCQAGARALPGGVSMAGPQEISLGIVGYNYTNRYIDSFSVDGNGGGNLFVSSPTSGGGGTTCCVPYFAGLRSLALKVRWQSGGCTYHAKSASSGEVFERIHPYFKEAVVDAEPPFPANPRYLEVHFYPDGKVKAFVTATESSPRLQLPKEREDRSRYPRCPNDEKPAN